MPIQETLNIPMPKSSKTARGIFKFVLTCGKNVGTNHLSVDEILENLLLYIGNSKKRMAEIVKNEPRYMEMVQNAKPSDFRGIIRHMLDSEMDSIAKSLHDMREESNKDYQNACLQWAKFAHGNADKQEVDITIREKRSVYDSISEEYRYSEAIDTEVLPPELLEQAKQGDNTPIELSEEEVKEQIKMFTGK